MVAEKNIIVAFEFGSSVIRGVAGKKEADGSLHVLAIEQERINDSIRRGTVHNLNKTTSAITRIKDRLNERLGIFINRAYVGIAGQSLHTVSNKVNRKMEAKEKVTQEMIDSLMDENRAVHYPDREVLEVAPQEYHLGIDTTTDPIGIQTDKIEGHYLNVIARNSLQENIRNCMHEAGLEIVELLITPLELAKALLPDTDKRSGCALVDIGAETTTVAIFTKNILRHLVTIPLGGKNITTDLAKLKNMEMEEAEELKLKYGVAKMSPDKDETHRQLLISNDRKIAEEELQSITSSRYAEIVANVWNQIKKGKWENDLLSGITLTGGAAAMKGLPEMFTQMKDLGTNKIKLAKQLLANLQCGTSVNNSEMGFNAAIALLMSANENCTGEEPKKEIDEVIIDQPVTINEPEAVHEDPAADQSQENEVDNNEKPVAEPKPKKKNGSIFTSIGTFFKKMVEEDE